MANKRKKVQSTPLDKTKYYRAIYINPDGTLQEEVYISEDLQAAYNYATGPNARGRTLDKLLEYEDFIDALF